MTGRQGRCRVTFMVMDPPDGQYPGTRDVRIRGERLLLRALRPDEIEAEWLAMVTADPGKGYGREALALLTDWLFERAAAQAVEAPTDPANMAMRTVFQRVGWTLAGSLTESGRAWVMYRISRPEWCARRQRLPAEGSG